MSILLLIISKKFNWPPNINQKWCSDIKEKEDFEKRIVKYSCNKKFSFLLSKHWLQRLFRSEEPDYKEGGKWFKKTITDPTPTEGIDLFFNSKEKINDFIDNVFNTVVLKNVPSGFSPVCSSFSTIFAASSSK